MDGLIQPGDRYASPGTIVGHQATASAPRPGVFATPSMNDLTRTTPPYTSDATPRSFMGALPFENTGLAPPRMNGRPVGQPGGSFEDEPVDDAERAAMGTAASAQNVSGTPY